MTRYVVEVNECALFATQRGIDWWMLFRRRYNTAGRIEDLPPFNPQGNRCRVLCDDREHADWLAEHMVEFGGFPTSAVKAKRLRAEVPA